MKKSLLLPAIFLLAPFVAPAGAAVIYSDNFSDGNRNGWYAFTATGGTATVPSDAMVLTQGTGSTAVISYFTPTTLTPGQTMTLTFDFQTSSTGSADIRFGLFNSQGSQINTDLAATSNAAFNNDLGYGGFQFLNSGDQEQRIQRRNSGNDTFWTTATFSNLVNSISTITLAANTMSSATLTIDYVSLGNMTISTDFAGTTRTVNITSNIITTFDSVSIFRQGGNSSTLTVDNVVVSVVPEPSTWALLAGAGTFVMILRRRRSCDS